MRAIAALVLALFSLSLASPALGADDGWHGWAFEIGVEELRGWVGAWTPGDCEALRREAFGEQLAGSIGLCHPVLLMSAPGGVEVWSLFNGSHFVAASRSELCDEEATPPGFSIRPVALTSPVCQRLWIRVRGVAS